MIHNDSKQIPTWAVLLIGLMLMLAGMGGVFVWHWSNDSGCFGVGGAMPGCDCSVKALWQQRTGGTELLHFLFIPYGNSRSISGHGAYGAVPRSHAIDSMPEGLFIDGKRVQTSATLRVFVLKRDATVEGVPLTSDELRYFSRGRFNYLASTDIWKLKIRPIVERETSPDWK